jgi:hypothetical protein
MRRREFITLLGGAATWPLAARAQQPATMRRVGVLLPAAADDLRFQTLLGAFLQGLALLGWSIGRNVRIDTRWARPNITENSQTRGGIGRARAGRHPMPWQRGRGGVAAGDRPGSCADSFSQVAALRRPTGSALRCRSTPGLIHRAALASRGRDRAPRPAANPMPLNRRAPGARAAAKGCGRHCARDP